MVLSGLSVANQGHAHIPKLPFANMTVFYHRVHPQRSQGNLSLLHPLAESVLLLHKLLSLKFLHGNHKHFLTHSILIILHPNEKPIFPKIDLDACLVQTALADLVLVHQTMISILTACPFLTDRVVIEMREGSQQR
jgi:hypothetical protein